ncbi:DUF943 family protein [Erwinia oleae]|uniref:DUF943 family protein n=1 Tax=Erwinia oleae TaxID=796334 RepID=UPI000907C08E|nr:DUF943 family protein [Erwinia oleae]
MKLIKWILILAAFLTCCVAGYFSVRKTEVIAVHREGNYSFIIVKKFPLTTSGKIKWWKINEHSLKENYHIPEPDEDGIFTVIIYDYGGGYQELKPDPDTFFPSDDLDYLICFDDMPVKANCIRKDSSVIRLSRSRYGTMSYRVDGAGFHQKPGGPLVKEQRDR